MKFNSHNYDSRKRTTPWLEALGKKYQRPGDQAQCAVRIICAAAGAS